MNPTRDLLNALRERDAARVKLARITELLDTADQSGMFGIGTRDIRTAMEEPK